MRIEGGWTRQAIIKELPTSIELAGVNMRLDEGVIRELHWHKEAEWAYVLEGEVRVTALDTEKAAASSTMLGRGIFGTSLPVTHTHCKVSVLMALNSS